MTIILKNNQTLNFGEFNFQCCIGKKGKTSNKKEGDLKTPKGLFELGSLYFRAERENKPLTNIKCIKMTKLRAGGLFIFPHYETNEKPPYIYIYIYMVVSHLFR